MDVQGMFSRIAPTYDLTNRVLSMGVDTIWRRQALRWLEGTEFLDLCAGTMDLTLGLLDKGATRVTALDFAAPMLDHGRKRLPPGAPVEVVVGDAQALPLPDASYDGAICGFGLRNVPDNGKALAEVRRVLRPGARFVVLEFFRPLRGDAKVFHYAFNKVVLPNVGGLISGDRAAYTYLAESMERYLPRPDFEELARKKGFAVLHGAELLPPVASLVVLEAR